MNDLDALLAGLDETERAKYLAVVAAADAVAAAEHERKMQPRSRTAEEIASTRKTKAKLRKQVAYSGTPRSL